MFRISVAAIICALLCLSDLVAQQSPHGGTPWSIPGRIEAEFFDLGGEGVAFHDDNVLSTATIWSGQGTVDIETCAEGGYDICYINPGEWLEYTVKVAVTGRYKLRLRVASGQTGGALHISMDNSTILPRTTVPLTNGWQTWAWLDLKDVQIDSGLHVMRMAFDAGGFNISAMQFITQVDTKYPVVTLTSPSDTSKYEAGQSIEIAATASDTDGTIARVEFFQRGTSIGTATNPPFHVQWTTDISGWFSFHAVAYDDKGAYTESDSVNITVNAADLPESPHFSVERGFYSSPFDLIVSWDSAGSTIRYTLDASDPRTSPTAIESPSPVTIRINPASTQHRVATPAVAVRAYARVNGLAATDAGAQTYIFIESVKTQRYPGGDWPTFDYDMDPNVVNDARYRNLVDDALLQIPTICVNTDVANLVDPATGIYTNPTQRGMEWERPSSIELIDPHHKEPGFQINGGLRLRGGYSRIGGQPKHAFRFFFRKEYGKAKLNYPLFGDEGVSDFDCVDLRTAQNYSWSYMSQSGHIGIFVRDLFSRVCQRDMGQPYTRSRNYHLFLDGIYWGLFQTQERSEASYAEAYFGGNKEDYDVIKIDPVGDGIEATDGQLTAYEQLRVALSSRFANDSIFFRIQGKNPNGTDNPNLPVLLDIDNMIDYMLVIFYSGNFDAPVSAFMANFRPNNYYAMRDRLSRKGFKFFIHDAEHALVQPEYSENGDYGLDRTGPYYERLIIPSQYNNPQWLHERLMKDPEYRVAFSDHIYKHFFNHGALTPLASQQRLAALTSDIDTAVIAESARWGDSRWNPARTKDDDWVPAVSWLMNTYFPARTQIVLQQLKVDSLYPAIDPPVFYSGTQEIPDMIMFLAPGTNFRLANNNSSQAGSILYTIDGTDPRLIGGAVSPSATDAGDAIDLAVSSNAVLKARIKNGNVWSALHQISLQTGETTEGLKITEIQYNPLDDGDISGSEFEFIELKNVSSSSLPLGGAYFAQGFEYTFPAGFTMAPNSFVVLASDSVMFKKRYGFAPTDQYNLQLDNKGERLTLVGIAGDTILTVHYNDKYPWPESADGGGYSLVAKNANGYGNPDSASYWRASLFINGSPGRDDIETGIETGTDAIPDAFRLEQNYPNPFNPSTIISFSLPSRSFVTLKIFDCIGREVATPIMAEMQPGTHRYEWNPNGLASGIYYFRLQAGSFVQSRKLVYLK